MKISKISKWSVALASTGALMTWPAATFAASIPVSATVTSSPTLTLSIAYGSGTLSNSATTAPSTSTSVSGITFPAVSASSSGAQTVTATTWVQQHVSVSGLTASGSYTLAWSSNGLTNNSNSADTIAPSGLSLSGSSIWTGNSSGGVSNDFYGFGGQTGPTTLSTTPENWAMENGANGGEDFVVGDSASTNETIVDAQPILTIPSGTAAGTYTGTITATAALT